MKILQNIVLSAALATSMVAFSTSTVAAEKKEAVSVHDMIGTTITHIKGAIDALDKSEKTEVVLAHIKEARQSQKDIIVGALDQDRQKASGKLVAAGHNLKDGKTKEARVSLEEALVAFEALAVSAGK